MQPSAVVLYDGGAESGAWRAMTGARLVPCSSSVGARVELARAGELVLARLELPRADAEENAFGAGVTLNPEHSAHFRRIGEWSSWSRVKTDDLGDGATKNCGGRAQIDHASVAIPSWMDGNDMSQRPLGWRSELTPYEHKIVQRQGNCYLYF